MAHNMYWEHEGVYWQYYGYVSGKEVIEASTSIYDDQRFDTLKYKLADFLGAASVEIDEEEVALVAYQHRSVERSNPYIKTAIVMKPADIELGNKFASFFIESFWDVRVFQEMDEANKWLGRNPPS
ncbi:MAG: hypothetical protein LJE83_15690 [Gammaproteobacteria bacterium]|nr:hypothetical protein [Gammaproteobacteria bacterium]